MTTTIRKGKEQDFEAVLELIKEFATFQQTPEKVLITVEQLKADKDLFNCFVAESEGNVVGFVTFFFCYYSWTGKAIYMDDLYVQPQKRGQGIGSSLLKSVYEYGKTQDCYKLRWQVSRWNSNAIGFYKSLGAEIDEVELNCDLLMK